VERVGENTVLSSIVHLLDRAQAKRPRISELADRVAGGFVAAILVLAAGVALWWWQHSPEDAFWITLSVLVVTCPCALSLATPVALAAATGRLARMGLLTTRGHALETLARITHLVFDKTGTLTLGQLQLERVSPARRVSAEEALAIAGALERGSEHPVARALVRASKGRLGASDVHATPGEGIEGVVAGRRYRLGNAAFVERLSGPPPKLPASGLVTGTYVALGDEEGW
jgi:Cu2+-exporting ATPase